ncbi:LOW QUALITY PROTEIN: hypothetical protein HZS_5683 [Henneguya salminicola]|nr:LOW QUALITY PROTEIN: hypothetical protein HZS_5683 [Henneguya salminicola]
MLRYLQTNPNMSMAVMLTELYLGRIKEKISRQGVLSFFLLRRCVKFAIIHDRNIYLNLEILYIAIKLMKLIAL